MCVLCTLNVIPFDKQIYIYLKLLAQFSLYVHKGGLKPDSFHFLFKTAKAQWGRLKFAVLSPKSKITVQNGCQKTQTRNANLS